MSVRTPSQQAQLDTYKTARANGQAQLRRQQRRTVAAKAIAAMLALSAAIAGIAALAMQNAGRAG